MIRPVKRKDFNIYSGSGHPELHRELEWFATDDNTVLGVVIFHIVGGDYSWMLMTEGNRGFAAVDLEIEFPTQAGATLSLHVAMQARAAASKED